MLLATVWTSIFCFLFTFTSSHYICPLCRVCRTGAVMVKSNSTIKSTVTVLKNDFCWIEKEWNDSLMVTAIPPSFVLKRRHLVKENTNVTQPQGNIRKQKTAVHGRRLKSKIWMLTERDIKLLERTCLCCLNCAMKKKKRILPFFFFHWWE